MARDDPSDKVLTTLTWQPQKTVSQEDFDEAVSANIDALGMAPEEAVQSAIEEFEMRNVNLDSIIKTTEGGNIVKHAMTEAITALCSGSPRSRNEDVLKKVCAVQAKLNAADGSERQENLAVCLQCAGLHRVLACLSKDVIDDDLTCGLLHVCAAMLQAVPIRDAFSVPANVEGEMVYGPELAARLLHRDPSSDAVVTAVGNMCASAAAESEGTKCKLMESAYPARALEMAQAPGRSTASLSALLSSLKALITNDDGRPPSSKAFMHARLLATEHGAVPVFLRALRACMADTDALRSVVNALQQLCANDDICTQVCERDGVQLVMHAIDTHFADAVTVATGCGLLRQLAKSDPVKVMLANAGGLDVLMRLLSAHHASPRVCTQALGLLATLLLRHPDHCEAAFSHPGLMDLVCELMNTHDGAAPLMRQACQVVRNMVVRNPDLRKPVLDMGVEAAMRSAKQFPECDDVASAALRDLGFDDYKH